MTGKLTDDDIKLLIPWYLNGTLSEEESKKVEEFLEKDPSFKEEMDTYNLIRSAVVKADEMIGEELSPEFSKMEESILERIDSTTSETVPHRVEERESFLDKIGQFLQSFTLPAMNPVPIAALLLIQFALIIGLVSKLYFEKPEQYTILSGSEIVEVEGPKILVAFENTATGQEIRDTLLDINARIIDGPKENGVYLLSIEDPDNEVVIENVIESLRNKKGVIRFAEGWQ